MPLPMGIVNETPTESCWPAGPQMARLSRLVTRDDGAKIPITGLVHNPALPCKIGAWLAPRFGRRIIFSGKSIARGPAGFISTTDALKGDWSRFSKWTPHFAFSRTGGKIKRQNCPSWLLKGTDIAFSAGIIIPPFHGRR